MDELGDMILHKCQVCGRHFSLYDEELINIDEKEVKFITCPYHGKHKQINIIGKYDNIRDCMKQIAHKRNGRRIKQTRY